MHHRPCYPSLVSGRIAIVSFKDRLGHDWWSVVDGSTVFEAVRNGLNVFADPEMLVEFHRNATDMMKPSQRLHA
jgi:hypothetical protein